jgi:hypothetical protein
MTHSPCSLKDGCGQEFGAESASANEWQENYRPVAPFVNFDSTAADRKCVTRPRRCVVSFPCRLRSAVVWHNSVMKSQSNSYPQVWLSRSPYFQVRKNGILHPGLRLNCLGGFRENYRVAAFSSPLFSADHIHRYHTLVRFTIWPFALIIGSNIDTSCSFDSQCHTPSFSVDWRGILCALNCSRP